MRAGHRTIGLVAAAVLGATALTGCAAGMIAQSVDQVPNHDGSHSVAGAVGISNALLGASDSGNGTVAWTAGSAVPITFWVTNDAFESDTLNSITSSVGEVTLSGDAVIPAQGALQVGGDSDITATIDSVSEDIDYGVSVDVDFYFAEAGKLSMKLAVAAPDGRESDRGGMNIYPEEGDNIWSEEQ